MLASNISAGLVQSLQEANKLLKFAKNNSDVKLCYEPLGAVDSLRLVCQFDAAFGIRRDYSSQGGWITMLINQKAFDGQECPYHVIDWKSSKLPRVTRSSLGAEAQAAGQAEDSVDFICRFWECLKDPNATLAEILERPSSLAPVLVTDAKALYDSFHRDGFGTGLTDRRTALEVKVIKEGLQSLGGSLRWHSSERQFADGLTKESTRQLLADRLRHHRLKFTWDPTYQASKRKDLQTRLQSQNEFSKPKEDADEHQPDQDDEVPGHATHYMESYVYMADPVDYVMADEETNLDEHTELSIMPEPEVIADLTNVNTATGDFATSASRSMSWWMSWLTAFCCLVSGKATEVLPSSFDDLSVAQCPLQIYEPKTEGLGSGSYVLDFLYDFSYDIFLLILFLTIVFIAYKAALVFGWHQGYHFVLRRRAVRAERFERLLEEKTEELNSKNEALEEMAQQLSRKFTEIANLNQHIQDLQGHLANAQPELLHALQQERAKTARLQLNLQALEQSHLQKNEQLVTFERHIRSLENSISEYERIRTSGMRVMNRAHNELEHHFNRYHRNGEIFVANRGTVWHTDGGCYHLHNSFVRELWPCQACAQDVMTPHIRNENGVTLHNAITGWLVSAQFFDTSNADYPMFPVVPGAAPSGAAPSTAAS